MKYTNQQHQGVVLVVGKAENSTRKKREVGVKEELRKRKTNLFVVVQPMRGFQETLEGTYH